MISEPGIRKRRISKLISRHGGRTSNTNTLDLLSPVAGALMSDAARLMPGEESLLACWLTPEKWCLLTTERLIACHDAVFLSEPWSNVLNADVSEDDWSQLPRQTKRSDELDKLYIARDSGEPFELALEPGPAFSLVWSAICALANLKAVEGKPPLAE